MLVEGVRDYAIYMLDPHGRITSWNSGTQAIKRYEERSVWAALLPFLNRGRSLARSSQFALEPSLRDGTSEAEAQRVSKDGSLFWTHVLIDPIYNEVGDHVGFAKITGDISEKKQAEQELRHTSEALLHSQKLQALGELAGGIAHDFTNLMTVMRVSRTSC